jgi:hypothetical protein
MTQRTDLTLADTAAEHLDVHLDIATQLNLIGEVDATNLETAVANGRVEKWWDAGDDAYVWPGGGTPTGFVAIEFVGPVDKDPLTEDGGRTSENDSWVQVA